LSGEFLHTDVKDIKSEASENYKDIKPEKEMSIKDIKAAVIDEFKKAANDKASDNEMSKPSVDNTKNEPEKIKVLEEVKDKYISDLKSKSDCPESIKDNIDASKLEKTSPEENAKLREEFEQNKKDLIAQWEKDNNTEWPKYTEPVYNVDGKMIKKVGYRYDAHHIQPLELGGKNEASNITPLDCKKHQEVHSKNGTCTNLVEKVKGAQNE